jgi:hypothetical protein
MLKLPDEWAPALLAKPETGMGYQLTIVRLRDGTQYNEVVVQGGYITSVGGSPDIPFGANEIVAIDAARGS